MKKISLLSTLILGINICINAQLSKPHFISLNVGTNIPMADYKKLDSIVTGTAASGLYFSLEGATYVSKIFGIGANIGAFTNPVDEENIKDQLRKELTENGNFQVNSSEWVNAYALVGPYLSFGSKKFIVDLKFLGGIVNSQKPLINVTTDSAGTVSASKSDESISTNFGLNYGVHFRIKLVGKLGLRVNAEGFMTEQEFNSKVESSRSNGETSTTEVSLKKEIEALNLGIGLALTF